MTRRKFAKRMAEHRDYAKFAKVEKPSGLDFNLPGHSFHHLEGPAVEQFRSRDPFILKARESWTIQKLDCFRNGQNKEPRIYTSLASVGFFNFSFYQELVAGGQLHSGTLNIFICLHFHLFCCCEHDP